MARNSHHHQVPIEDSERSSPCPLPDHFNEQLDFDPHRVNNWILHGSVDHFTRLCAANSQGMELQYDQDLFLKESDGQTFYERLREVYESMREMKHNKMERERSLSDVFPQSQRQNLHDTVRRVQSGNTIKRGEIFRESNANAHKVTIPVIPESGLEFRVNRRSVAIPDIPQGQSPFRIQEPKGGQINRDTRTYFHESNPNAHKISSQIMPQSECKCLSRCQSVESLEAQKGLNPHTTLRRIRRPVEKGKHLQESSPKSEMITTHAMPPRQNTGCLGEPQSESPPPIPSRIRRSTSGQTKPDTGMNFQGSNARADRIQHTPTLPQNEEDVYDGVVPLTDCHSVTEHVYAKVEETYDTPYNQEDGYYQPYQSDDEYINETEIDCKTFTRRRTEAMTTQTKPLQRVPDQV